MKMLINQNNTFILLESPHEIVKNLSYYQRKFDLWMANRKHRHNYWVQTFDGTYSLCFGPEAFIEWANTVLLKESNEKVTILKENFHPDIVPINIPVLNL